MTLATYSAETSDEIDSDQLEETSFREFVTFLLENECFAFPMQTVREIIRMPQTAPMPLTPIAFRGIANLRGAVLPILDLRTILGLPHLPVGDATRVIVVDCGRPVGLVVDRVASVISVASELVEFESGAQASELAGGVIKNVNGHELIQLLDAVSAVKREFARITSEPDEAIRGRQKLPQEARGELEDHSDGSQEITQLVSLMMDGQEYGFDLKDVDEIVRVPKSITKIPEAPTHVLGLVDLRGRLLPLLSLRQLFGLPEEPIGEQDRIVVIRGAIGTGVTERIGIMVDQVREVLSVSSDERIEPPQALRGEGPERIEWLCRLKNGERLIGVLGATALFDQAPVCEAPIQAGSEYAALDKDSIEEEAMDDDATDDENGDELQLVVYRLAGQEYGAPINSVQEIIRIPETIFRSPLADGDIAGMINLRGAVLPVAGMRRRFALEDVERNDRQRILVLAARNRRMGFIVDSVTEVLRVSRSAVEAAPECSPEQENLLGSVANLEEGKRIILMLNAEELLGSAAT